MPRNGCSRCSETGVHDGPKHAVGECLRAILVRDAVVTAERSKGSALGGEGHAPGESWRRAARSNSDQSPADSATNGVVIEIGRQLHGFGATSIVCPACKVENALGPAWNSAEAAYVERGEVLVHSCAACGTGTPSTQWEFDWPMAFGALAVTFWNWPPLKRSFVEELEDSTPHNRGLLTGCSEHRHAGTRARPRPTPATSARRTGWSSGSIAC